MSQLIVYCTVVLDNAPQNSSDNVPSYPPDNSYYWEARGHICHVICNIQQVLNKRQASSLIDNMTITKIYFFNHFENKNQVKFLCSGNSMKTV